MLETQAGRDATWTASGTYHCRKGAVYDVPTKLAEAWLAASACEKVRSAPKKTASPAPETTTETETMKDE
jgi:hypothetical protein